MVMVPFNIGAHRRTYVMGQLMPISAMISNNGANDQQGFAYFTGLQALHRPLPIPMPAWRV